jgi:ATP-dependent exoDNAse (exonuclease V) alpha subunit
MIRGIGPIYAKKLVRAFGEKVFDTIEGEPERLREVTGIGPVRAGRITAAWAEQKIVREIMVFLHSNGVGTARAVRIYKTYGADAVQVMSENPYRLARDIRGIGFKTADAIAMKLGIEKTAMIRVRVGISYALTEAMDEGHSGLPTDELVPLAEKLLEVPAELVRTALDLELAEGTVIADSVGETRCVFLAGLHRVDVMLMQSLMKAAPDKAALLIVGDIDQLPSVGPGQVMSDLISSGAIPVVRLTEVFRQAAQSRIITSAHRINQGSIPDLSSPRTDSDFYFVQADDPETAVLRVIELVKTRIPSRFGLDSIRDIQVLCPMNRGGVGARSLNILQAALNPAGERKVERFGWTLAPGDKVMQIENDYDKEVYNGDIGYIDDVAPEDGELIARFDGRSVTYGFGELDMLVPAYATTIHKSQGSEYPAVVIPVMTQHYAMLQRNLLYTGVTRGKRLVVLVGQKKAVAIAVRNVSGRRRWSKLQEWLRPGPPLAQQVGMVG